MSYKQEEPALTTTSSVRDGPLCPRAGRAGVLLNAQGWGALQGFLSSSCACWCEGNGDDDLTDVVLVIVEASVATADLNQKYLHPKRDCQEVPQEDERPPQGCN